MNETEQLRLRLTRRAFLHDTAAVMGLAALASLMNPGGATANRGAQLDRWRGTVSPLHFAPRAKRVIWLYMAGGPSHLETLDYKPELARRLGQPMPDSFTRGQPIAQLQGARLTCFAP